MHGVRSGLVLRPNLWQGAATLAAAVVITAVLATAMVIGDAPTALVGGLIALHAAMIVLAIRALFSSRITLTADEIVVRGLFSRQRRPRSRVAEVVRATIAVPRGAPGESLFVLDEHRKLLIRVSGGLYAREDLDRFVDALGVPCGGPDGPVDGRKFAETYPGLISWAERHPYRLVLVFVGVVCVVIAVLVLVSVAAS